MAMKLTEKQRQTYLDDLRRIAENRGGRLLSTVYVNSKTKLDFEDSAGNVFSTCPASVKRGYWSPYERNNIREHAVRQVFEYLYGCDFPPRNDVVVIAGRKNLQLDGYCEKLRIAFEYQGHHTHRFDDSVMERDRLKRDYCLENGITLVLVDDFRKMDTAAILSHVMESITRQGLPVPRPSIEFSLDYTKLNHSQCFHALWVEKAERDGYAMLSEYVSSEHPVTWKRISDGVVFTARPHSIQANGWPTLSTRSLGFMKTPADHLQDLRNIAESRGGQCLATEWLGANAKYEFRDADGTVFAAVGRSVKSGKWRRQCKYKKK